MPSGYSGQLAVRYLGMVEDALEEAHAVIDRTPTHIEGVQPAIVVTTTYVSADGVFTGGQGGGGGTSVHVTVDYSAFGEYLQGLRLFCSSIGEQLLSQLDQCDHITNTSLILPQTGPQVQLIAAKLRAIVPQITSTMQAAEGLAERFPQSILAQGGTGLEVNRPQADAVMNECETLMRSQVAAVVGAIAGFNTAARTLEARATTQRTISLTAMMTEIWTDDRGRQHSRTVPCTTTRNRATLEFRRLTGQVEEVRICTREHETAVENLEQDIMFSRRVFENDCDEVARCDAHFAAEFDALVSEMQGHARAVQQINESFCPTSGIVNWNMLMSVKSGMTQEQQDALFDLTLKALLTQMSIDDDSKWAVIEGILGRDPNEMSNAEFAALTTVLMVMEDAEHLQQFMQLLTVPIDIGRDGNEILLREMNHAIIDRLAAHLMIEVLINIFTDGDIGQRNHAKQVVTILEFMARTPYAIKGEAFPSQQSEFLSLLRNDNGGLVLSFTQFGDQPWGRHNMPNHLLNDRAWNQREITFSEVLFGGDGSISDLLIELIGSEAHERYGADVANVFLNGLFTYGPSILQSLLSYIPKVGKPLGTALTAGSVSGNLHNMINAWLTGYTSSQHEGFKRLSELNALLANWNSSVDANHFKLNGVIVHESGALNPQISLFPGEGSNMHGDFDTFGALDSFNNVLESAINNSVNPFDLESIISDFNAEHGTTFNLDSSSTIADLFENLPLFSHIHGELRDGGHFR